MSSKENGVSAREYLLVKVIVKVSEKFLSFKGSKFSRTTFLNVLL
jgi:hypothetical protein